MESTPYAKETPVSTVQQSTVSITDLEAEVARLGESLVLLSPAEVAAHYPLRLWWATAQGTRASQASPAPGHLSLVPPA